MANIKPTVGRVLWFYAGRGDRFLQQGQSPFAAMIAKVISDKRVNLSVLDSDGIPNPRLNVSLIQPAPEVGKDPPLEDYCTWMPYQVGQAAKTEELEKVIASGPGNP